MASRPTRVERMTRDMNNAGTATGVGYKDGVGGTKYMILHLDVEAPRHDSLNDSLFLGATGRVTRPVLTREGDTFGTLVDPAGLK